MSNSIVKCGRSADHPAEIAKRAGQMSAGRVAWKGFFDHKQKHGEPKLIFGDAEKFAADLKKYRIRCARRSSLDTRRYHGTDPRFYVMPA